MILHPRKLAIFGLFAVSLAACEGRGEIEEAFESTTELPESDGEVEQVWMMDLDEERAAQSNLPLGETVAVSGHVSGIPLSTGFFLRTAGERLIFVQTDESVTAGSSVRVEGAVTSARVAEFEGWEANALDAPGVHAEWDIERLVYIDAAEVRSDSG